MPHNRVMSGGRSQVAVSIAAVVLSTAVVGGVLWYRAAGPRLERVGFGVGGPVHVGETVHVGIPVRAAKGAFTITELDVDVVDAPVSGSHSVVWSIGDGNPVGVRIGDLVDVAPDAAPALGHRVDGDMQQLLLSVSADTPGVYRFEDVRVTYGSGLRKRTTELPVDVCLAVVPADVEIPDVRAGTGCYAAPRIN